MADSSLVKKLGIKPNQRILVLKAPGGYFELLGALPEGVERAEKPDGQFDLVQLFVKNQAELELDAPVVLAVVKPGGLLWLT